MLTILYRDDRLVVIDKPSGWLVHRSNLDRGETRILVQALRDQIGCHVFPPHRLDKGTSGALIFALDSTAAQALAGQFERQEVRKTYLAVVRGWPPESGRIDHAIAPVADAYAAQATAGAGAPQAALTDYCRLASAEFPVAIDRYPTSRYALMALEPHTGRRHQLRRHMKHISHPIIGDATHGKGRHNRFFQERFGCQRLLLHCAELCFSHPVTGHRIHIHAPLDDQLTEVVTALGWHGALDYPLLIR